MTDFEKERDAKAGKYAEKQRRKRLGTARTYEEFDSTFKDGADWADARSEKRIQELEDHLDLMVDEFRRIAALDVNEEIKELCFRGITQTKQRVSVIIQRNNAQEKIQSLEADLESTLEALEDIAYGEQPNFATKYVNADKLIKELRSKYQKGGE